MKHHYLLPCIAVLAVAGCHKASDPAPAPKPDYEAMAAAADAQAEELAARAHLTGSMTDEQILRAIGADPSKFKLRTAPVESGGGTIQTSYTNETTQIEICRTPTTGALLVYHMPWNDQQRWMVKGKAP
jgi:hypothetical protein